MKCDKEITWDGWHWHRCDRKAKFVLKMPKEDTKYLCGIHVRAYKNSLYLEKIEKKKGEQN